MPNAKQQTVYVFSPHHMFTEMVMHAVREAIDKDERITKSFWWEYHNFEARKDVSCPNCWPVFEIIANKEVLYRKIAATGKRGSRKLEPVTMSPTNTYEEVGYFLVNEVECNMYENH